MNRPRRPTFSVCILTRNRPEETRRAIESVLSSPHPAHQVIVSDNSTDDRTRDMVAATYPQVTFMEGPRRGLSSNRNKVVSKVTGTHVLMMDDDAALGPDFLDKMADHIEKAQNPERLILTGVEMKHDERVVPHKMDFLGFQSLEFGETDEVDSIVINATVFPVEVFRHLRFDVKLTYGYDENEFMMRAVHLHGYRVKICHDAVNFHYPPGESSGSYVYANQVEANRIYVTFKKYFHVEKRAGKALGYLALAYTHHLLHQLKRRRLRGLAAFGHVARLSLLNVATCFRDGAPRGTGRRTCDRPGARAVRGTTG